MVKIIFGTIDEFQEDYSDLIDGREEIVRVVWDHDIGDSYIEFPPDAVFDITLLDALQDGIKNITEIYNDLLDAFHEKKFADRPVHEVYKEILLSKI